MKLLKRFFLTLIIFPFCCLGSNEDISTDAQEDVARQLQDVLAGVEGGDAEAQFELAVILLRGGFEDMDRRALELLKASADQGHAKAQNRLGAIYRQGKIVLKDQEEAFRWFYKAATRGNTHAQVNLANSYALGKGVKKNYSEAVAWLKQAAMLGDSNAQAKLGHMYRSGTGVEADPAEAAEWYKKASEQDHPSALAHLGALYSAGEGVPKDDSRAFTLFQRSARLGNPRAQYILGMLLANRDSSNTISVAHMWLNLAAAQGMNKAAKLRGEIESRMSPAELAEARQLAHERSQTQDE